MEQADDNLFKPKEFLENLQKEFVSNGSGNIASFEFECDLLSVVLAQNLHTTDT